MTDILTRLNEWLEASEVDDADQTLRDARDEIVALRALLQRQSEAAHQAVTMMGSYAEKYGFLQGGLEMVALGHATADRVLASAKKKYGDYSDSSMQPSDGQRCMHETLSTPGEGSVQGECTQEPVAWAAVSADEEILSVHLRSERAIKSLPGEGGVAFPLYRQPQPTITSEEREAIAHAADLLVGSRPGATLRALLERLA